MTSLAATYGSFTGTLEGTLHNCIACSRKHNVTSHFQFDEEYVQPDFQNNRQASSYKNRIKKLSQQDNSRLHKKPRDDDCTCSCHSLKINGSIEAPKIDVPNAYALKLVPTYDKPFEELVLNYLGSLANTQLSSRLQNQGRQFYNLRKIGIADLEGAVAAVAMQGDNATLLGSLNFSRRIDQFARAYRVPKDVATRYVLDHEFVHVSQKGKYFDDTIDAELDVEHTLQSHYKDLTQKEPDKKELYSALCFIAKNRANNVAINYGKAAGKSNYN